MVSLLPSCFKIDFGQNIHLVVGPSNSPYIPIFKRVKASWGGVTCDNFRKLEVKLGTEVFHYSALAFLKDNAEKNHTQESEVRDGYQELIELTMVVLGRPPSSIHWRASGPIHHACQTTVCHQSIPLL